MALLPKIQFTNLPAAIKAHLVQRSRDRSIRVDDLLALQAWFESNPIAPDGDWYKDLGSFILCASGQSPKTVLAKVMEPFGDPIA
ncbi:MAG: hypothetical protein FJW38_26915 [Acidobacteria bacterium]|nr:hypothetical protein [Acidobacteriota bacterium]